MDHQLLRRLCEANGVSGDEQSVREIILEAIQDHAEEITVDPLGNILVKKKGRQPAACRLLFSAHMDEVGLMVTDITPEGYLKFDEVGGIDRRILPGKRVKVGSRGLPGVIGIKPIHLTHGDEENAMPALSDMYIDIGADSAEEALQVVGYGDSVYFDSRFLQNDSTYTSKALDDRFGCYVMIQLIRSDLPYDTLFSFVVQEEVGLRGAKVASYTLDPDFAVVLETTTAADIPETDRNVCTLGDGAVISLMDRHTIYDKELVRFAFDRAGALGVKAQYKRAVAGGNDAGVIHQSRGGVRTLAVSLACRYLHSANCVANIADCDAIVTLARDLAEQIAGGALSGESNP